ncbi:MAG: hypothetical protein K6D37_00350 [Prevotella sp.]|nr:hypothetical protein [Prevotella sp.]
MSFIKYIADERSAQRDACPSRNHYKEVLSLVGKAKQTVWIGTTDIKDLCVDDKPFLALIAFPLKKGMEVRAISAH